MFSRTPDIFGSHALVHVCESVLISFNKAGGLVRYHHFYFSLTKEALQDWTVVTRTLVPAMLVFFIATYDFNNM